MSSEHLLQKKSSETDQHKNVSLGGHFCRKLRLKIIRFLTDSPLSGKLISQRQTLFKLIKVYF